MSNQVFPSSLPGLLINVQREADYDVKEQYSLTRKRQSYTYETYPLTHYRVGFEILRSDSSLSTRARELQQALTHIARHYGSLESFLLIDPADSSVTDHGFAVGDGVTTAFQLQRTLAGDVIDAAGVEYASTTKPYLNMVKNSSFETDTNADGTADSWAVYNNESATVPAFATIVPGRLPNTKAQRVSWGTNAGTTKGVVQTGVSTPAYVAGQWYTVSFFARASGTNIGKFVDLRFSAPLPNQQLYIAQPALTAGWQRYVFQLFWNAGTTPLQEQYISISGTANGWSASSTFGDLDFDDVQVTTGQWGVADLMPLSTPAAATGTDTPSYWPSYLDGYEPITDLNGDATVYQDGDWMGRRTLYPWARTNLLPFSEQFDNAAWTKTNATISANAIAAPDGTTTADQFNEGAAVTVTHLLNQNTSPGETQGELRCYSIFMKANTLPNVFAKLTNSNDGLNINLAAGSIASLQGAPLSTGVQTSPLWPGWFRFWFIGRAGVAPSTAFIVGGCLDATYTQTYTGTSRTFFVWGAMCERVSNLLGPTPYIKTPSSAAVTVTDYALSATGLVTLAVAMPSGAFLSFDANYYRRVKFESGTSSVEQLVQSMWAAKSLELVTVK